MLASLQKTWVKFLLHISSLMVQSIYICSFQYIILIHKQNQKINYNAYERIDKISALYVIKALHMKAKKTIMHTSTYIDKI